MIKFSKIISGKLFSRIFFIPILVFGVWFLLYGKQVFTPKEEEREEIVSIPEDPLPSRAEIVMNALSKAYPERISPTKIRDGDWAFFLNGEWFYYAEGRILPEQHRDRVLEYNSLRFYDYYFGELPPWQEQSSSWQRQGQAQRTWNTSERIGNRGAGRPNYFFDAVWNLSNRDEAWAQMKKVKFLGHTITIHNGILKELNFIEKIILKEAETNPDVKKWLASLGSIEAWNWRNIASSTNRSFHSYGIAIDILPKSLGGLATYWLWTSRQTSDWRNIPYSGRYHPPDEVIQAFESVGFVWGGKWAYYDTMHFEYRPEVFVLNNIPLADIRGKSEE